MTTRSENKDVMAGTLYLVATPIGNLDDMSFRAVRVLRQVNLVAAEDTRHSRKLFNHYEIRTRLTSFFEHNEEAKQEQILTFLRDGQAVALISDAGTPGIADPGFKLVRACQAEGIVVVPIPGPSAVITALSVAGVPTDRFAFEGFLPSRETARRTLLERLKSESRTLVFYESPHRLAGTLEAMVQIFGKDREMVVARELTKVHEELVRGPVPEVRDHFLAKKVRGELVLIVPPGPVERPVGTVREALLKWSNETELPMKEIVKLVAKEFGLPGSEVYRESLELRKQRGLG